MMLGKLQKLVNDPEGNPVLSIALSADFREAYDELYGKDVSVDIKPWRKGRSLEANAFSWALIGKIAAKMQVLEPEARWTPEKVYQDAIRDLGEICMIADMETGAVETFRQIWVGNHLGRQVEVLDEYEGVSNVKIHYGSSDFDTAQMSRFISILIQQAESLGIPTLSDQEVERMLGNWKKSDERRKHNGSGETNQKAG